MKWTDVYDIAICLEEQYPGIDVMQVKFTDLHKYVLSLEGFNDAPNKCNEKILEAIQLAWLEERN